MPVFLIELLRTPSRTSRVRAVCPVLDVLRFRTTHKSIKYARGRDHACLDILPKSRSLRGDGTRQWVVLCWNPCAFAMRVAELEFEDAQREGLDANAGAGRVPYVVWS